MPTATSTDPSLAPRPQLRGFETLMPYRIQEVILVSSLYDAFILQEDGQIADLLLEQGREYALDTAPQMVRAPDVEEALERLARSSGNELVIVTPQMGAVNPVEFAEEVKQHAMSTPVVLLGYDAAAVRSLLRGTGRNPFDEVFLWTGDARILTSIVTLVEDRINCVHDCENVGVRAILLVEDSLGFLSAYLPLLHSEILQQSRSVLSEGVNIPHKLLRIRARPKLLLARDLDSAERLYEEHREHLLGVISDVGFPRHRRDDAEDREAGLEFLRRVRERDPNLPVLLQSSNPDNARHAEALRADFADKSSPLLHEEMRRFMLDEFGFGPFRFETGEGGEDLRARNIRELETAVREAPAAALVHHGARDHFSSWLRARLAFDLADRLSAKTVADFADGEEMRGFLLEQLADARRAAQRGAIADFDRRTYDDAIQFARIGGGSLGGKARGLAFVHRMLPRYEPDNPFEGVEVAQPPTVVLTTEIFDRFMRRNRLHEVAFADELSEEEREAQFLRGRFPGGLLSDLRALLQVFRGPLAVRSSSLLEDSHHQPFAGIYETVMIRNQGSTDSRLAELCRAIKRVYASTYSDRARAYVQATAYHQEDEKMAVVVQPLFGRDRNGRYYPTFAGVARSHNFYPHGQCAPEDGVCSVALGLGRLVVGGEGGLRFCPRYPQSLPDFSTPEEILQNAQRTFYALPLHDEAAEGAECPDPFQPCRHDVEVAERDGVLPLLASTWMPEDGRMVDGVRRGGTQVVTFAGVLKHDDFPLAPLVAELLRIGQHTMGCPVEIEFAVDLETPEDEPRRLALLQIRPMAVSSADVEVDLDAVNDAAVLCASERTCGNGTMDDLRDVVFVDPAAFDRARSGETARDLAQWNARLAREERPYLLVGPGRWGSKDPWLGIPVNWNDISGARVVVETGFEDVRVQPSEGSHFFHTMTSFGVGYLTVNPQAGEGTLDLDWLRAQAPAERGDNGIVHLRLERPLQVLLDGRNARGAVLKPGG